VEKGEVNGRKKPPQDEEMVKKKNRKNIRDVATEWL